MRTFTKLFHNRRRKRTGLLEAGPKQENFSVVATGRRNPGTLVPLGKRIPGGAFVAGDGNSVAPIQENFSTPFPGRRKPRERGGHLGRRNPGPNFGCLRREENNPAGGFYRGPHRKEKARAARFRRTFASPGRRITPDGELFGNRPRRRRNPAEPGCGTIRGLKTAPTVTA